MNKRFISVFLVAVLVLSMTPSALAAGSLSNFMKINTYFSGMFKDVPTSQWYADEVQLSYEFGIVNGKTATAFEPDSYLTIAETIKMAVVLHSIYNTGKSSLTNGNPWYQPYVDYALQNGIISSGFPNYNANATRADFARIFAAALPAEALTPINQLSDTAIPDVSITYSYGPSVYLLYRAGVLTGSGENRAFKPNDNIKRSEVAAIAARMISAGSRVTFSMASKELTAADIAAKCSPSVFYIEVSDKTGAAYAFGSGFFISSSGLAVTNFHVIDGAASAKIMTTDKKFYNVAGVYDYSETHDLALLQIDGSGFPYLDVGDSSTVVTGATVYAIGNPEGLDNTFSQGVVSNSARTIPDCDVTFIQFDAAISHGSSGGALLNAKGQIIGVPALLSEEGQNLNFAIPINLVNELSRKEYTPLTSIPSTSSATSSAYAVTANPSNVTVAKGSTVTVKITDSSGDPDTNVVCVVSDESVVSCEWGSWTDNNSCTLDITGLKVGTATVTVYLVDEADNPLTSTKISVTVAASSNSISASPSSVSVSAGNQTTVTISKSSSDENLTFYFIESNTSIVTCSWGDWNDVYSASLHVKGISAGTATVTVYLIDQNENRLTSTTISVTVSGSGTTSGGGTTGSTTYYSGYYPVPDYGAFVGAAPFEQHYFETLGQMNYMYHVADFKVSDDTAVNGYINLLKQNGFTYYQTYDFGDSGSVIYRNPSYKLEVSVDIGSTYVSIWIENY